MDKEKQLAELARCVLEMEDEAVVEVAKDYIDAGYDAYSGIVNGLSKGMEEAGHRFEEESYFVPELLICSDAMYNGLDVLKPHLLSDKNNIHKCAAIMGVVKGDTHDIGKNLVKIMMETAGFEVYDLGRDVSADIFVEKARKIGCGIICLSTLMTTTMDNMGKVIEQLKMEGIRENFKIMVGGGPVSQSFADKIGADAYTYNAAEAAKKAQVLAAELQYAEKCKSVI